MTRTQSYLPAVLQRAVARFRRSEAGTATVEFVLMIWIFLAIFMASFESGLLMTRFVMMERALDMTVRDLRLGNIENPTHESVRAIICSRTVLFDDCNDIMMLELQPVSTTTWSPLNESVECVNRASEINPVDQFTEGTGDEMMLVRACAVFDPIFPGTGIGLRLPRVNGGGYAVVATSAFVNEPA
jgi:Flp pilus assembly protein TadG